MSAAPRLRTGTPGPQRPLAATPPRRTRSVRRTYSTDLTRPEGVGGPVVADIRGHDVRTDADGKASVVDRLAVSVALDQRGAIAGIVEHDVSTSLADLIGVELRGGYGRRLGELLPDEAARRSLLYSAFEDLGGANLVGGYAPLHAGIFHERPVRDMSKLAADRQADICSGWAADGPLLRSLRDDGITLVPYGPPAPVIEDDDALGWHAMAPLAEHTVRRRRRLDVTEPDGAGESLVVQSHFRDSHMGHDGESVMHEYLVDARVDGGRLVAVDVDARVLPWDACPGAVGSAQRLVGLAVDELPARVRADLVGVGTCTHLNSTLRCLADLSALEVLLAST